MKKYIAYISVLILLAKAYQYFWWDAPLRIIIWDEDMMSTIVQSLMNYSWEEFVTDLSINTWIRNYSLFVSGIFLLGVLSCFFLAKLSTKIWLTIPIGLSSLVLLFHSILSMKAHFNQLSQVFEMSIQIGVPIVLILIVSSKLRTNSKIITILKVLTAITFAAHGLYAIGYYPVPGHFIDMIILSLGVTEEIAKNILLVVGVLDISLLVILFIPATTSYGLIYAAIWGLLTAFARTWAAFDIDFPLETLHQSLYKTIVRLPNGLIPLLLWWMTFKNYSKNKEPFLK